jgi:glycosyltransferase involved in cell wall biosynthesis
MDDSVRVLWLIKGLGTGGAERLLVSAARVGDHDKFRYEVAYVLAHKDALVPDLASQGVPSTCLSAGHTPWPVALRRLLTANRYDVVHLHSPLVAGVARLVVLTLPPARRPVVVSTEHNTWDSYATRTRLLNATLYRTDRRRWAVSPTVKESIWKPLRGGVEVLIHGIVMGDVAQVAEGRSLRAELGIEDDESVGVTVANFRSEKAYPDLLDAASLAVRQEHRLRLVIVGQGPLESEVRALHAKLGLDDRCLILGYRDDVPRVLAMGDFFVMSSRFEGLPVALMEAMAAGLPAVATTAGGIPSAVTHGEEGYLSAPGDPKGLADAMVRMARDSTSRARMAAAARRRASQFDMRNAMRVLERSYLELGQRRGERQPSSG